MNNIDLTIIIVNWNSKDLLCNCLRSILQSIGKLNIQIIVVDNSSSDGSQELVRSEFKEVLLIDSKGNIGFGRANNLAIPHAESSFILFLNPDTIIYQDSLEKMIGFIQKHPRVGALGCKTKNPQGIVQDLPRNPISLFWIVLELMLYSDKTKKYLKHSFIMKNPEESQYLAYLYGACLMVRKNVLDRIGYFDEQFFMYCEDIDLCHRIGKAGWQLYYLSSVEILHIVGGTTSENEYAVKTMCESRLRLCEKYYGNIGKYTLLYSMIASSLLRSSLMYMENALFHLFGRRKDIRDATKKQKIFLRWALDKL